MIHQTSSIKHHTSDYIIHQTSNIIHHTSNIIHLYGDGKACNRIVRALIGEAVDRYEVQ